MMRGAPLIPCIHGMIPLCDLWTLPAVVRRA